MIRTQAIILNEVEAIGEVRVEVWFNHALKRDYGGRRIAKARDDGNLGQDGSSGSCTN